MARPLRIEFAGAIYHLMSRGSARQVIFSDDADRQRLVDGLEDTVARSGWELSGFVLMPNHSICFCEHRVRIYRVGGKGGSWQRISAAMYRG